MSEFRRSLNFREIGGYVSEDGRRVKHNLIYRSAAPHLMNEEELKELEEKKLSIMLDLRTSQEAHHHPDPVLPGVHHLRFSALPKNLRRTLSPDRTASYVRDGVLFTEDPMLGTRDMYEKLPFHNKAYRELFHMLYDGAVPILLHCSEGKDRTGIACILILLALGVSEEQALDDFVLTNKYMSEIIHDYMSHYSDVLEMAPELEQYYLSFPGVSVNNAIHALHTILNRYGTYEQYFLEEYGMDRRVLHRLRSMYLE